MRQLRQLRGVHTTAPNIQTISNLSSLQKSSAKGPFQESIKYSIHPSLLNIQLPSSASLNVHRSSVIASTPNLDTLASAGFGDREYINKLPVNLLIGGKKFVNLSINKQEWIICKDNLVAWDGVSVSSNKSRLLNDGEINFQRFNNISVNGKGTVILKSLDEITKISLGVNESMFINSGYIIAHNGGKFTQLDILNQTFFNLYLSKLNLQLQKITNKLWTHGLTLYNQFKKFTVKSYQWIVANLGKTVEEKEILEFEKQSEVKIQAEPNQIVAQYTNLKQKTQIIFDKVNKSTRGITTKMRNKYYQNEIYYKAVGPVTILISNHSQNKFNDREMNKIIELSKR